LVDGKEYRVVLRNKYCEYLNMNTKMRTVELAERMGERVIYWGQSALFTFFVGVCIPVGHV
jgi:hypothetical protein